MQHLNEILFIDIETVPIESGFNKLNEGMQSEWVRKAKTIKIPIGDTPDPEDLFGQKAGIFSEFAKVVCIGIGSLYKVGDKWEMRLKALVNDNESILLTEYAAMLEKFSARYKSFRFCGHNIKEFDLPFICRRMIINGIQLPPSMDNSGKKPWEVTHLDTMEMWKFGDYKNYTSLSLLAQVFGIPSPKSDIDGSMVGEVYWKDGDLERIGKYCLLDVFTTAKVYLRLKGITNMEIEPVFVTT